LLDVVVLKGLLFLLQLLVTDETLLPVVEGDRRRRRRLERLERVKIF
jgi:hypothetical protein